MTDALERLITHSYGCSALTHRTAGSTSVRHGVEEIGVRRPPILAVLGVGSHGVRETHER
jgi:hypothetical protein